MNNIDTEIINYLRDAQWRTAELTVEMDAIKDDGNTGFKRRDNIRAQLSVFMDLLYISDYSFYEGFNFLSGGDVPWTDIEIQSEIDYLRSVGEMSEMPFLTFTDYQQNVVVNIIGDGSIDDSEVSVFPYGNQGDFLYYANAGTRPIATPVSLIAGHNNETIDEYFNDRA